MNYDMLHMSKSPVEHQELLQECWLAWMSQPKVDLDAMDMSIQSSKYK